MKLVHTILLCVVVVFVLASILCHIIALFTNYWLRSSSDTQANFLNVGLFNACFDDYIHPHEDPAKVYDGCDGLSSDTYKTIRAWLVPQWLVACRIVAIIGLVLQLVGLVFIVLLLLWIICKCVFCDERDDVCEKVLIYATPIIFIVAGMFIMMAVMIFADNAFRLQCKDFWLGGADPFDNHLSYSWNFEVAATVLTFISGGFLIWASVLKARDDY
ncbi:hypothetical protein LSAT2_006144 [Lamellibrachia satsuma]|nr:hypothetical protein LSAT2_006144 [Lamellibrachia satsuma]